MERLLKEVTSQVSQIFPEEPPARQLFLCPCASIDELEEKLKPSSTYFGLLLAMDASKIDSKTIGDAADRILAGGLVYLCAWGSDCERVHDIFDESALDINDELTGDDVIMTTSHKDEPLREAVWYFVHAAFPTESFWRQCTDWIIAPVGNHEWEKQIRLMIHDVVFLPPQD